jgi:hypothetical protein
LDARHTPGDASSSSGGVVGARMVPAAIGTQVMRQPAEDAAVAGMARWHAAAIPPVAG